MKAILQQLDFELERFQAKAESIETFFIGGGTPSTISPELFAPFFEKLAPYLAKDAEITTEANPNSATQKWLEGMRQLGVNRISFGVQSFHEEKLKLLGRNHHAKQAIEAPCNAKEAGFENISIDLIYGTHIDTKALLAEDLRTAFTLPLNHLSAYSLTIEEGTKFLDTPEVSQDDENLAYWFTKEIKKRFLQYEISNFGTYQSKHNLGYWKYKDYIGIGSGAVGFLENRRFYPSNSIEHYIDNPLGIEEEHLTPEAIKSEKVLLGLRSIVGIEKKLLSGEEETRAKYLIEEGKLYLKDSKFYNPNFFLSDEIALYLLG
jgi:oxygen-independent coproporphyrinogen-3 oxidase